MIKAKICLCCGLLLASDRYRHGTGVCASCESLSVLDAVLTTRASMDAQKNILCADSAAKAEAKKAKKLATYAIHGKRCSACWHPHPASAYSACRTMGDGLQPICRSCASLEKLVKGRQGLSAWHAVRDALRTQAPAHCQGKRGPGGRMLT